MSMKPNIETKDEALKWLSEFMEEVNSQDNRITATPYYYELRQGTNVDREVKDRRNFFFTESAAKRFISNNSYALPKGVFTYVTHAFRNREIQNLLDSIGLLTGVKYERK